MACQIVRYVNECPYCHTLILPEKAMDLLKNMDGQTAYSLGKQGFKHATSVIYGQALERAGLISREKKSDGIRNTVVFHLTPKGYALLAKEATA